MKKRVTAIVTTFMKISLIISFLLLNVFSPLFASHAFAQKLDTKVSIHFKKGQSLANAIEQLRNETRIKFSYDPSSTSKIILPERTFKNETLHRLLDLLFDNSGLTYKEQAETVIIYDKPVSGAPGRLGTGSLKGRIVEFETAQPLPGASVQLLELNKTIVSDQSGYYKFSSIPSGKYTLKVSYVSYTTEKVPVTVKEGKEETYDVKLSASNTLNEVVVSATQKTRLPVAHSTAKQVLQEVKNASITISAISSEQISKSADRNAGEAVKKIAGVSVKDDKFIIIRGMSERYNLTYLNDNIAPSTEVYSRAFALDLLPTRIIDRILVYKTPSPELMGDMTGGAVKIFTKDAKMVKSFDIEAQVGYRQGTTYKDMLTYKGGKTDFLGFDDGTRKLPSVVPVFGDVNKARITQKDYVNGFNPTLNYGKRTALPAMQLTMNYYNSFPVFGKQLSSLTSLSYKNEPLHLEFTKAQNMTTFPELTDTKTNVVLNPATNIGNYGTENQNTESVQLSLLQNFIYNLKKGHQLSFKNYLLQQGQSATVVSTNFNNAEIFENADISNPFNPIFKRNISLSYTQRFLYSGNFTGMHDFLNGKHHLNWNLGYTYNNLSIPDQRQIRMQNLFYNDWKPPVGTSGDFDQNWIPQYRSQSYEDYSGGNLELGYISRSWIKNTEHLYNGSADYTYTPNEWAKLKLGTYQHFKDRGVYRRTYTINEGDLNDQGQLITDAIGGDGRYMDFNKILFRQQDLNQVWSDDYLRDDGSALKVYDRTSGGDSYIATEQNNSFYAAVSITPLNKKIDLYGGLRLENNIQKIGVGMSSANTVSSSGSLTTATLITLKTLAWLPSVNFSYRPSDSWVLRASAGRTLNRPEFKEIAPFREVDYLAGQYVSGNPHLVGSTAMNYDMRFEFYPKANEKGETLSIGGFYKNIDKPIERSLSADLYFSNNLANISFTNADKAKVYGIELDARKDFSFLGGNFFRNLSTVANASYIFSEATIDISRNNLYNEQYQKEHPILKRRLQGQAPYLINAGLFYENSASGTKIGILYNRIGERIYAASLGRAAFYEENGVPNPGNRGSLLELPRNQMDLSFSQRLMKGVQMKLGIQNLLNTAVQMAEDSNFDYKYNKATYILSSQTVSETDTRKRMIANGDVISSSYKPGQVFTLSASYNF